MAAVSQLMRPYDLALEVAPYKKYIDAEGIARLAAAFNLPSAEPPVLLARLAEYDEEAGVDENGLYVITTLNPDGHWDSWTLRNLQDDVSPVTALSMNIEAHAVITPDGQWHDFEPLWNSSEAQLAAKQKEARKLIMSFLTSIAVTLDYHR